MSLRASVTKPLSVPWPILSFHFSPKVDSSQPNKVSTSRPEPDLDLSEPVPFLNFLGYAFCPGTCVFGPWVKYSEYVDIFNSPRAE